MVPDNIKKNKSNFYYSTSHIFNKFIIEALKYIPLQQDDDSDHNVIQQ